jgi:hypothetical protein
VFHVAFAAKDHGIFACQRCPNAPDIHKEPQRLGPRRLTLNRCEQ